MTNSPQKLLPLLALVAGVGILTTSIYLPSLPAMAEQLDMGIGTAQATLTVYLFAFGACQLAHGPLSDQFGRKPVLLGGLAVCILGSLACAAASSGAMLMSARILQAIGACAGIVVTRAVIRDLFDRRDAAAAISLVGMTLAVAPALAPMIGGHLHVWFGWRANFIFVASLGALAAVLVARRLPETNQRSGSNEGLIRGLLGGYTLLARSRPFWGYTLSVSGIFAGLYAFMAGAPVLLIGGLGIEPDTYGMLAAMPTLGYVAGSFVTNRLIRRCTPDQLMLSGSSLNACAGVLMLLLAALGYFSAASLIAPMVMFSIGMGLTLPNALASAVSLYPQAAGAAAAAMGCLQMVAGGASSLVVLSLPNQGPVPLAGVIAAVGLIGWGSWMTMARQRSPLT